MNKTDDQPILRKGDMVLFNGNQLYVQVDYYAGGGTVVTDRGNFYFDEVRKINP